MANDTLLSSLCSICHAAPVKYVCPRCYTQTCSAPCVKKHKAWKSCNGVRDATAFMPLEKLRTPAGIDHDYNFLSAIDRSRERTERILVGDRGLPSIKDTRQDKFRLVKEWEGEAVVHRAIPLDSRDVEEKDRGWMRHVDVNIVRAPPVIRRYKENQSRFHKRSKKVNWQVEWLIFQDDSEPKRVLHHALENVPLCAAYAESQRWQRKLIVEVDHTNPQAAATGKNIPRQQAPQDETTSAWIINPPCILQDPRTRTWSLGPSASPLPSVTYQYFLHKPQTPANEAKQLIPLSPTETLSQALSGRTVLEFPTIYVLPRPGALPAGYRLGSTTRLPARAQQRGQPGDERTPHRRRKRLVEAIEPRKRVKFADGPKGRVRSEAGVHNDAEDGEINSEGEEVDAAQMKRALQTLSAAAEADHEHFIGMKRADPPKVQHREEANTTSSEEIDTSSDEESEEEDSEDSGPPGHE